MKNKFNETTFQYLCPPGNGVYTVHTAKEHKEALHQTLYQTTDEKKVKEAWQKSIQKLSENKKVCLLGITSDCGGGIQRGANWGPLFIRSTLNLDSFFDLGDTRTIPHLLHDKYLNEKTIENCREALYGQQLPLPVSPLSITEHFCDSFNKNFPELKILGLGGDHSVSYPLVQSWIKAKKKKGSKVAVIHFDAHTDLMVKRLGIDLCFGSWAYHILDLLDDPADLIQFGIRSSGQNKEYWQSHLGVQQYWAQEVLNDVESIITETIEYLADRNIDEIYISFDIDALDSKFANATGTPESEGLTPELCTKIINKIGQKFKITGADLVEVAPFVNNSIKANPNEPMETLGNAKVIIECLKEAMN